MNPVSNTDSTQAINALRAGIKRKYNTYHALDRDRFPLFDYNTNRANYQTLRDSFETEFYEVRKIDRARNSLHIPSTNTLALLFSSADFVPGKKILSTCLSYAESKPEVIPAQEVFPISPDPSVAPATAGIRPGKLIYGLLFLVVVVAVYGAVRALRAPVPPSGLLIQHPIGGQAVGRFLTVAGKVANADTVWIVVRPIAWDKPFINPAGWNYHYVQPPIRVNPDGTWKGIIYIGGDNKDHIGVRLQIRAFVHPDKSYQVIGEYERYIFGAWPSARLSTEAIEVVRAW